MALRNTKTKGAVRADSKVSPDRARIVFVVKHVDGDAQLTHGTRSSGRRISPDRCSTLITLNYFRFSCAPTIHRGHTSSKIEHFSFLIFVIF